MRVTAAIACPARRENRLRPGTACRDSPVQRRLGEPAEAARERHAGHCTPGRERAEKIPVTRVELPDGDRAAISTGQAPSEPGPMMRTDSLITRVSGMMLTVLLHAVTDGADHRKLEADRDAFTPTIHTVAPGDALFETAYTYIENRTGPATQSLPELLVRTGLTDRFELRFGANYEAGSGGSVVTSVETGEGLVDDAFSTEATLLYGCKALVTEQHGLLPRSVVLVEAFTPTAGDVWGTEPTATYALGWTLPEGRRFDAGIRYVYADSEEGTFDKWMPSVVLRWPITERFELHGEWFGTWTKGLEDETVRPFVGPAGHFVIVPGLEFGARVGWGLTRDAANFYSDIGFAWLY